MKAKFSNFSKAKEKYLKFIKSQEVAGEPFKDKLGQLNNYYIPISEMIYKNYSKNKRTSIIGLSGGQGTGKSTISNILKIILKEKFNLETVIFSIDDFYKTLRDRKKMSKTISKSTYEIQEAKETSKCFCMLFITILYTRVRS